MADPIQRNPDTFPGGELDPANQSLADALRKSFAVLKALMLVMVVAYALSGWVRVQSGEVGMVVRMGQIAGIGPERILRPGWHWSFPYPIDQVITLATQRERQQTVSFMFQITEEDRVRGIHRIVWSPLSPLRDNYLLTGDANILHAQMVARYRISDPVAYATHVYDMSPGDERPPEADILESVLCDAAIRVAARQSVKQIYGSGQQDYLNMVAEAARTDLAALEAAGQSTGLEMVGVIAPQMSGLEAILPPRQVQQEFDRVVAADQQKSKAITTAVGKASELLNRMAGADHAALVSAIDAEFEALLAHLRTGSRDDSPTARALQAKREETDRLLLAASGEVQRVINTARSDRDRVINEAEADYEQLRRLRPEYDRNGSFLLSRLRTEFVQQVVADPRITKKYVPDTGKEIWLQIPSDPNAAPAETKPRQGERTRKPSEGFINRNPIQTGPRLKP